MNINFYFIFMALCTSTCLHASQVAQKETAQHQQATPLEWQMIKDAEAGRLTEKTLQRYLKKGADINAKNNNGFTALMWTSYHGRTAVVQQLIAADADINAKNNNGTTALMGASDNGQPAAVQQLITAGADINAKNNDGYTALMYTSANGNTAVVQQLIAAGADHTIANEKDNNNTAREYAEDKNAYDKAVAAGLADWHEKQAEYRLRQTQAKQIIAKQTTHIPGLQDIIMGYAYGPSPVDLPPSQEEEKKSDSETVLETAKNKKEKKSNCVIQ